MSLEPFETAEGSEFPHCRQLSVFLENRLGQLMRLTRLFEDSSIHIIGLASEGTVDCAIVRLLVDDPDTASAALRDAGFATAETDILVVELPPGRRGIMTVCAALIAGEVNINYMYPLLPDDRRPGCIAIQVDDIPIAVSALEAKRFRVLDQSDIES